LILRESISSDAARSYSVDNATSTDVVAMHLDDDPCSKSSWHPHNFSARTLQKANSGPTAYSVVIAGIREEQGWRLMMAAVSADGLPVIAVTSSLLITRKASHRTLDTLTTTTDAPITLAALYIAIPLHTERQVGGERKDRSSVACSTADVRHSFPSSQITHDPSSTSLLCPPSIPLHTHTPFRDEINNSRRGMGVDNLPTIDNTGSSSASAAVNDNTKKDTSSGTKSAGGDSVAKAAKDDDKLKGM
jgi:hypothetical protein